MTIQFTSAQALKSFTGAALFGLGMDLASTVSCPVSDVVQTMVRDAASLVFWAVLSGWQATQFEVLGHTMSLVGCPVEITQSLGSLVQALGRLI
jgi:hypothetical protein